MFHLETILKLFKDSDPECDIPLTVREAMEIVEKFKAMRTALRRIVSLDDKNVPKFAKQIAEDGLRQSHE